MKNYREPIYDEGVRLTDMIYLKKRLESEVDVKKVVDLIAKVDLLDNPKPSYTVGRDAKFAEIISKLPFALQNKLIKLGMKKKFGE